MVAVSSSYRVVPKDPTPNGCLQLSCIDQIQHLKHELTVYFFQKSPETNNALENSEIKTLRESLSKILVYYYPIAGRLRRVNGNRLELELNGYGVMLYEAHSEAKIADYGDFAPSEALADLIPHVDYSAPMEEWPLLLVKLTKFSCGGLCIGIAVSHIVGDGSTWVRFIRSWAKLARGENLQKDEIPFHDRMAAFRSIKEPMNSIFNHKEYQPPPVVLGDTTTVHEMQKESTAAIFHLTPEQVKKLQKKANEGLNQNRPYSRYEAIAGHIWKCACMARSEGDKNSHQPTVIRTVASIRNRLKPLIPLNYAGNAILSTLTTPCFFKDLLSNPLNFAAKKIREAIESMTDEYCRSVMDWLSQNEIGSENVEFFYGNPNFNIGSWTTLPVYDADFGWGNPVYMGPAKLSYGKACIMPSPSNDGSLLIALRFETRHFKDFEDFFYQSI